MSPDDFIFQLSQDEAKNLISQFAISRWGGKRKLPFAFTEQGRIDKQDSKIKDIFDAIQKLLEPPPEKPKQRIGFIT